MKHGRLTRFINIFLIGIFLFSTSMPPAFAGDKIYFYHNDPSGTPIVMTDESGAVVWEADYLPFGEDYGLTVSIDNNKMFVGKEKDKETGLYYFGARYMEPKIGRFISPDPVGPVDPWTGQINQALLANPQALNPYVYALNNPYKYLDPDGREVWLVFRKLNTRGGEVGVHSFVEYKPDNPSDFNGQKRWVTGGYKKNGELVSELNNKTDLNWKGKIKGKVRIPMPKGKTDSEHIKDTMKAFNKYKSGSRDYEAFPEVGDNEGNCNNISTGTLVGGGVSVGSIKKLDPPGFNPGLGKPLPEMIK